MKKKVWSIIALMSLFAASVWAAFCPKCGKEVGESDKFCAACGVKLAVENQQQQQQQQQQQVIINMPAVPATPQEEPKPVVVYRGTLDTLNGEAKTPAVWPGDRRIYIDKHYESARHAELQIWIDGTEYKDRMKFNVFHKEEGALLTEYSSDGYTMKAVLKKVRYNNYAPSNTDSMGDVTSISVEILVTCP